MTKNIKPVAPVTESTWTAVVALLMPAYPGITKEYIQSRLTDDDSPLDYIPCKEACRILHCDPSTLWRWRKEGRIRGCKPCNGKTLYSLSDIRRLLQN